MAPKGAEVSSHSVQGRSQIYNDDSLVFLLCFTRTHSQTVTIFWIRSIELGVSHLKLWELGRVRIGGGMKFIDMMRCSFAALLLAFMADIVTREVLSFSAISSL